MSINFQSSSDGTQLTLLNQLIRTEELEQSLENMSEETADKIQELTLSGALFLKQLPSNLSKLTNLKIVRLNNCHSLENLNPLTNSGITQLFAPRCLKLSNIQAIASLQLKTLDLSQNANIDDFTPITKVKKNLESLSLEGVPIEEIAFLKSCERLNTLNLTGTDVTDLSPVLQVKNLKAPGKI